MKEFAVYYGHDPQAVPELTQYELVVLESRGWDEESWRALSSSSTKLLGYLSPFAWPDWLGKVKWWWGRKERDEEWNAWWLSLSSFGWRRRVKKMWQDLPEGLDGLFFDNLDRLQDDPESLKPFKELLKEIRSTWPEAILMGNRGFSHWSSLDAHLNAILFENLTDQAFSPSDRKWVVEQLECLRNTQVYALDYDTRRVPPESERLRSLFPKMRYYCAPNEGLQSLGGQAPTPG